MLVRLVRVHNITSLSHHEQVCSMRHEQVPLTEIVTGSKSCEAANLKSGT